MINTKISLGFDAVLELGCPGEKDCRCFEFDLSGWLEHFQSGGMVRLLARRPYEHESYPCVLEVDEDTAFWTVGEADVQLPGRGCVQLQYVVGDSVLLSAIFETAVGKSLVPMEGEPPAPQQPWVQEVLDAAVRAEEAAKRAEEAGGGTVDPKYIEGIVDEYLAEIPSAKGEDGGYYIPEVQQVDPGLAKIIFNPSKDGMFAPDADENGQVRFQLSLPEGKDGYSPVRGEDYWTDTDKAEIKSYVDEAILGGAW